ncbi:MAG: flagellar basal body rod C-terminal domain-containing protein, partial [Pseudomonadota bacterium]
SVQNGLLSGLDLNGMPLRLSGPGSGIAGGTLSAQFEIRDTLAPEAQADLDTLARDLVERFEDPALDPSRAAADPGLFTDGGAAFDVSNTLGLANRLALNSAADPASGGESWRLRAGLGASAPGSAGDATLLNAMGRALTDARAQPTTRFGTGDLTAAGLASALMSGASQNSASGTGQVTFAATLMAEMQRVSLEQGVDTDSELQSLMQIEQAYAANARVLEVIESLMDTLLRI